MEGATAASASMAIKNEQPISTSTPNSRDSSVSKSSQKQQQPLQVTLPAAPSTPILNSEATLTPPPRSPGATSLSHAQPDGNSSDKSSETAAVGVKASGAHASTNLSRKESYKAQRQHYRREKARVTSALLHSLDDPSVILLSDWLKVRGTLKSWTKLWCVLKPGLLLLYKSSKAKSSHWVGTVLLSSCQVIERPSKKDGFCFKLYHPLEQSIWAPRGPHNETIGAVVQPLPTAHLIFRAPSQAAGHCWLDGLELALKCTNSMLRCSRTAGTVIANEITVHSAAGIDHDDLEKHFNDHASPKRKIKKTTKWSRSVDNSYFEYDASSENPSPPDDEDDVPNSNFKLFEFWKDKKRSDDSFIRNVATTSSTRSVPASSDSPPKSYHSILKNCSKSLASTPAKVPRANEAHLKSFDFQKRKPIEKCLSPTKFLEENFAKFVTSFPKRRSSTPSIFKTGLLRLKEFGGFKAGSENDLSNSIESPAVCWPKLPRHVTEERTETPEKYSLINYDKLPSVSLTARLSEMSKERDCSQRFYVAGNIVSELEDTIGLSDSESDMSMGGGGGAAVAASDGCNAHKVDEVLAKITERYELDNNDDVGAAGELVEEIAEENKSLLWFLIKQVRPGMDLSKVVLPTFILEPRSFLDKLSDNYYHADILSRAVACDDPYGRFKTVLKWYLSGLYKKPRGLKKPYNPVLGEVFRCYWLHPETGTRTFYVAEQVSHHPPVSAFYVSNRKEGFIIEGSFVCKSKFYGNSTSAILDGLARVILTERGETYYTSAPYAHCKGLVVGTLSMELGGKVFVSCPATGYKAEIEFKLKSFLGGSDQTNAVYGRVRKGKEVVATIDGYWDGRIDLKDKKTGDELVLVDCNYLKTRRLKRYLVKLEHQIPNESAKLWSKVSDAINSDNQVAATDEKTAIEEMQREKVRAGEKTDMVLFKKRRDSDSSLTVTDYTDNGWRYMNFNPTPWHQEEELLEFECNFVIKSLFKGDEVELLPSLEYLPARSEYRMASHLAAESLAHHHHLPPDEVDEEFQAREDPRIVFNNRQMKKALLAIDMAIREQTRAIDKLSRCVETMGESQRNFRPLHLGRVPQATHAFDIFAGFVMAFILQALINWIFIQKWSGGSPATS